MITWTASLEVGVKKVDDQHKELVDNINKLHAAMMERKGKEVVGNILNFLKSYAISHFSTEESLMRLNGYPNYEAHKKLHEDFKVDFLNLAKDLAANPESPVLTIQVENRLSNWLVNHIKKVDKETMAFLVSKGVK